jgi:hypothetical protein
MVVLKLPTLIQFVNTTLTAFLKVASNNLLLMFCYKHLLKTKQKNIKT